MDKIAIIEKCVELCVRRDTLVHTLERAVRGNNYAKLQGDKAYNAGNYKLESGFNTSTRQHRETEETAKKDLDQVTHLLEFAQQEYIATVESLNPLQLREASLINRKKAEDVEKQIKDLTDCRESAISQGDEAYAKKNYQEEQVYNGISSSCYIEIEKKKPVAKYYNSFADELKVRAYDMADQSFGPTGPRR